MMLLMGRKWGRTNTLAGAIYLPPASSKSGCRLRASQGHRRIGLQRNLLASDDSDGFPVGFHGDDLAPAKLEDKPADVVEDDVGFAIAAQQNAVALATGRRAAYVNIAVHGSKDRVESVGTG